MSKYKKKPVIIEAIQWKVSEESWREIIDIGCPAEPGEMGSRSFYIPTLEGEMKACEGDWIIKGVNGEFYPCKPDIFEKTYSPADETPPSNQDNDGYVRAEKVKDIFLLGYSLGYQCNEVGDGYYAEQAWKAIEGQFKPIENKNI